MSQRYRVVVPPSVKQDLKEIIEYHHEVNQAYSRKLFNKVIARVRELETFPEKGRVVPELRDHNIIDYKELIEDHFRIVYRIYFGEVLLISVIDGRRNVEEVLIQKLKRK